MALGRIGDEPVTTGSMENKICGCVSEEAPNQLTAADLTQILTPEGRTRVVAEVGAKTVTACYKRLFTQR